MALVAQSVRLSRRLAGDALCRWISATVAAGSRDTCAGVATAGLELQPPQGLRLHAVAVEENGLEWLNDPVDPCSRSCRTSRPDLLDYWPEAPASSSSSSSLCSLATPRGTAYYPGMGLSDTSVRDRKHGIHMLFARSPPNSAMHAAGCGSFSSSSHRPKAPSPSYLNPLDAIYDKWIPPLEYFHKNLPFCFPHGFPGLYKPIPEVLFRWSVSDLVRLVSLNRSRGIDIGRDLTLDNLLVSERYRTFALKFVSYHPASNKIRFMGYKAVSKLLKQILEEIYGPDIMAAISDDVDYYFNLLENDTPDDDLIVYNAFLLGRQGRIGLSLSSTCLCSMTTG